MSIEFNWNIVQLDCKPEEDGKKNIVTAAHWTCSGVDGSYTGYSYGSAILPASEDDKSHIEYEKLTKDLILEWCWSNGVNKDDIESDISAQIDLQKNPPVVLPTLPWGLSNQSEQKIEEPTPVKSIKK